MNKRVKRKICILNNAWLHVLWLLIGLVCLFSMPTQAIWLGQSQVNPFLEIQGTYETNIFQTSADEEHDVVTVLSPGLHLEFPTVKDSAYRLLANYRANLKFYGNHGDAVIDPNEELNTIEHRLDGQLQFSLASGLKLAAGYILNLTSVPPDFAGDTREQYTQHEVFAQVGYAFVNRYEVQLRYDGTFKRFEETGNQMDDLTAHRGEVTFFYRLFNSVSVLGGGGYAQIDRQEPDFSDSTEYRGFGGLRLEMTERLTGVLKAGVLTKKFDREGLDDTTAAYVSGEVIADLTETTRVTVKAQRDVAEATLVENALTSGVYSVVTGLQVGVTHTLSAWPKLAMSASCAYQHEAYPEDVNDRRDNQVAVGVGAEYTFLKYLVFGAHFAHTRNDSNLDANDYSDNIVMLKLRAIL